MRYFILLLIINLVSSVALADAVSIGGFAETMMGPASVLSEFVNTAALIVGSSFIFAGILKYFQFRTNPLVAPLSTVIFLFIFGIALVLLPLAHKYFYDTAPVPPLVAKQHR